MNFSLIGAAGYIAPRHMHAIMEIGANLSSAYDLFDSVGIIDRYFPEADFYTEFEEYYADILKRANSDKKLDYISVCSPNYLHKVHSELALHANCDVICEKPICLSTEQISEIQLKEVTTGCKVNCILQLRLHESVTQLREKVLLSNKDTIYDVDLTYVTSRGKWYLSSWKNEPKKSGGILQNIGIHFFDMLIFVFGSVIDKKIFVYNGTTAEGYLRLERARVRWRLSIDENYLPTSSMSKTFRNILIDGENFEMSKGFTDLHTKSYSHIINGLGFSLEDALPSVKLTEELKTLKICQPNEHELIKG